MSSRAPKDYRNEESEDELVALSSPRVFQPRPTKLYDVRLSRTRQPYSVLSRHSVIGSVTVTRLVRVEIKNQEAQAQGLQEPLNRSRNDLGPTPNDQIA